MSNNFLSLHSEVNKGKDWLYKKRIEDTIVRCGCSKREFYSKVKITKAYWYLLSWRIEEIPVWLKTRLCDLFGKPFIDFFLIIESEGVQK